MAIRYRSSFAKMGVEAQKLLVDKLAQLGKDAIDFAFKQGFRSKPRNYGNIAYHKWLVSKGKDPNNAWDDITGNLRDSFGSAVYVNGELQRNTIRFANDTPTRERTRDAIDPRPGREVLLDYFNKIHPNRGKNDVTLVCVAAMYYTKFLEAGTHRGHYKIRVISAASDYVRRNWERAVSGIYQQLRIKKPSTKVIKGDIQL